MRLVREVLETGALLGAFWLLCYLPTRLIGGLLDGIYANQTVRLPGEARPARLDREQALQAVLPRTPYGKAAQPESTATTRSPRALVSEANTGAPPECQRSGDTLALRAVFKTLLAAIGAPPREWSHWRETPDERDQND